MPGSQGDGSSSRGALQKLPRAVTVCALARESQGSVGVAAEVRDVNAALDAACSAKVFCLVLRGKAKVSSGLR